MKKKILAIFPSVYLYGKERSNIEVFNILANDKNINFRIIANKKLCENLRNELKNFNVIYCSFPSRANKRYRFVRYLYNFIKTNLYVTFVLTKFKPDIIYINNEMSIYDLYPMLAVTKSRIIYRIGDIPAFPTLTAYKLNSFLWKSIVIDKIDTIISISKFIKNEVDKTGRNSNNDTVIYNYPPQRKRYNYEPKNRLTNILTIGYLGQIRELKGVHLLIDAVIKFASEGNNIKLLIAGDINLFPLYFQELSAKIADSHNENRIKFLGEIDDISDFFNHIDILCVPTIWPEALGNVLVEAKQYHKPLIIFPSGGMPELVRHKLDGYICKNPSSQSLIEAFNYYTEDPEEILKQGRFSYESLHFLGIERERFVQSWKCIFNIDN